MKPTRITEKWREDIEKGLMPERVSKTYIPEVSASESEGVRKAAFVVSTGSEDRDGDTVNPAGWMLDNYRKNPVVLWAHDVKSLPIARAESIGVHEGKLKSVTVFPEKGVYPFADQVYGLLKGGFLKGTSVGFHPVEAAPRKGVKKGVDFNRQELYEFSLLPIPSNREALVEAKAAGHDIDLVVKWASAFLDQAEASGLWIPKFQIEKALAQVRNLTVTVPAMPPSEAGVVSEGHAIAGAVLSDDEMKALGDLVEKEDALPEFVTKHGDHDQKSHGGGGGDGDGGGGGKSERVARASASLRATGGFSLDKNGDTASSGFMVSPYKSRERIIDGDASDADIAKYEADNADLLAKPGHYFGGWKDGGKTYLDVSLNVPSRAEAHALGAKHGQLEVWNVADKKSEKTERKESDMDDLVTKIAEDLFGEAKAAPPWMKEGAPAAPAAAPAEVDPKDAANAAKEAAEAQNAAAEAAKADAPADGKASADPTEADPQLAGILDDLARGLLAEIEPLKRGGEPTNVATALKAALEKFAASFMQTYVVPGAQAGAPGAPAGAPPAPAGQPAATPPPPPGAPLTAPAGAAKPPLPAAFKKGLDSLEGITLDESEVRATIQKVLRQQFDEARMHLTGRLPG